jgi:hypothetical protein
MATGEWQPTPFSDLRGRISLLDLTALLVLYDLELLDKVFSIFPTIAIGQRTLIEINQLISPMIGSLVRDRCVELQTALKRHLARIMQPVASLDEEEVREELLSSEEIKWLALHKGYLVYSDDALFRMYCDAPGKPASICTLDLLHALDEGGHMPANLVAAKLAQLCDWQVGLSVLSRYQIAALPDELGRAGSVRDGVNLLRQSPVSTAIFNGIWGSSKPYKDLQAQAGALLRELVDRPSNSVVSIASLMALWQEKARLRADALTPPVRVIALLIMQAAHFGESLSDESARRLWSVFRQMVENEHGDHMDERKEAEAITLAGDIAAHIDNEHSLQGDRSLQSRLTQGLTRGTKDESLFSDAYNKARIEVACKIGKHT